ncbi:MAG: phenylpyruvate tautomerase MIF-related protein [Halanaeroarchaeum sp.]
MPYLTFDVDRPVDEASAEAFEADVAETYARVMDADTSYVAVAVREVEAMYLGRAEDGPIVVLTADIRRGRSQDRRRTLALELIDLVSETFDVPRTNQKVVFTEHDGALMMGHERVGSEWTPEE